MEKSPATNLLGKKGHSGSIRLWVVIILGTLSLWACKSQQPVAIQSEARLIQHYIPVLKGANNDILELSVDLDAVGVLQEIEISVAGEEGLLTGLQVYLLMGEGEEEQKLPLAAMGEAGALNTLEINKELAEGTHRFLISVIPNPEASLTEKFEVNVPTLVLDKGQVKPMFEGE